jgi:hypothetical protein
VALRGHWGDKDGDNYNEYGFGFDYKWGSFDVKTEDPTRSALAFVMGGALGPAGVYGTERALQGLAGDTNLTEATGEAVVGAGEALYGAGQAAYDAGSTAYDYLSETPGAVGEAVSGGYGATADAVSGAYNDAADYVGGLEFDPRNWF